MLSSRPELGRDVALLSFYALAASIRLTFTNLKRRTTTMASLVTKGQKHAIAAEMRWAQNDVFGKAK